MNISSLNNRLDRIEASLPATEEEELRECDKWPPSLSWFAGDEVEHVKSLVERVSTRISWRQDGTINFDLISYDELVEMAEVQEKVLERSQYEHIITQSQA
jgi:hypothetical protein